VWPGTPCGRTNKEGPVCVATRDPRGLFKGCRQRATQCYSGHKGKLSVAVGSSAARISDGQDSWVAGFDADRKLP
jgi:hypothetical protein